jgi:hypothetical protein
VVINQEDEKYVYKKVENCVVLKVPIIYKEGKDVDIDEIYVRASSIYSFQISLDSI